MPDIYNQAFAYSTDSVPSQLVESSEKSLSLIREEKTPQVQTSSYELARDEKSNSSYELPRDDSVTKSYELPKDEPLVGSSNTISSKEPARPNFDRDNSFDGSVADSITIIQ